MFPCKFSEPFITVEPQGGLCNRMRVIESAAALARDLDRPLCVIWNIDGSLGSRFDELFIVPAHIRRLIHRKKNNYFFWAVYELIDKVSSREAGYLCQADIEKLMRQKYDFRLLANQNRIHIATNFAFYPFTSRFGDFTPVPELQVVIRKYTREFNNVVGVHMRRIDHKVSIEQSPTELFHEAMQKEVDADQNVRFFLATDDPEEEDRMCRAFSGRVITYKKKSLRRDDPQAIRDAVIDLFILSKCSKIIASYYSTFSNTASVLGGVEKQVIKRGR